MDSMTVPVCDGFPATEYEAITIKTATMLKMNILVRLINVPPYRFTPGFVLQSTASEFYSNQYNI